jgi:hypothetical protein
MEQVVDISHVVLAWADLHTESALVLPTHQSLCSAACTGPHSVLSNNSRELYVRVLTEMRCCGRITYCLAPS